MNGPPIVLVAFQEQDNLGVGYLAAVLHRNGFDVRLMDFRLGHTVSGILAVIFLLLAAVWLYPSPVEGRAVMGEIAQMFTLSVGPWMMVVFLIGAFAATFSTAFNYFDGWPRIVGACCRNLFRGTASLPGTARRTATRCPPDVSSVIINSTPIQTGGKGTFGTVGVGVAPPRLAAR